MTSPKYKLSYFNLRGRGEPARYLFAMAQVSYEDFRFEINEWDKHKPDFPYGQAPMLEINGKTKLCQSKAISRYLAEEFGFRAKTPLERAKEDMIVDCIEDFLSANIEVHKEDDEEKKKKLLDEFMKEVCPTHLRNLTKMLEENNGTYFVGEKVSWVDLFFAAHLPGIEAFLKTAHGMEYPWVDFPKLKQLIVRVESEPKIAAWIERRPVTSR